MAAAGPDLPVEGKTVRAMVTQLAKRGRIAFQEGALNAEDEKAVLRASEERKMSCKIRDEFAHLSDSPYAMASAAAPTNGAQPSSAATRAQPGASTSTALIPADGEVASQAESARRARAVIARQRAVVARADGTKQQYVASVAVAKRLASRWPKPKWHAPWQVYRTIAGHLGWVRSIAFDPGNEWFVTGSGDRTIKVWDLASGSLKLTLTGHIEQVTGLAISDKYPYMFSCGLDKKVMCWDLEQNKVIRNYHGHLSGVFAVAVHPELPLLMTGGRDSTCRVWDMRSRVQVHCMSGHQSTVASILSHGADPQVITGSHDNTIRTWDIRMGKTLHTLTYHKKSVRALAMSPNEYAFLGGSADNIKKYKLPDGEFCHNMIQDQAGIINDLAINEDGVVASGADNGSLWFWDWRSGNCFQQGQTIAQPGSLESENGIFALAFDRSGSRLITCEADKSIKMWKEDLEATEETHPINFRPPKDVVRRY